MSTSHITIAIGTDELEALRARARELYGSERWIGRVVRLAVRHSLDLARQTSIDELDAMRATTVAPARVLCPPILARLQQSADEPEPDLEAQVEQALEQLQLEGAIELVEGSDPPRYRVLTPGGATC